MTAEGWWLCLLVLGNLVLVLGYFLVNRKKKNAKGKYLVKIAVMLLCPVLGPLLFALSFLLQKLLFKSQVDLEDVIFSKEKKKAVLHADEERERNMVPLQEAIAVSDKTSLRDLTMNVVKGDIRKSLAALSLAMNSEDSETSHYAASVLQDELNNFRTKVQREYLEMQKAQNQDAQQMGELILYMNEFLAQRVFAAEEQKSLVGIMEAVGNLLYEKDPEGMTITHFEDVALRLLDCKNYVSCQVWCDRTLVRFPGELASYTIQLKLYFTMGEREKFFQVMNELKHSDIIIDKETLELIRVFQ